MNDIERQIEDSFKDDDFEREDDTISKKFNHRGNDKKKIFLYVGLGLVVVIIISLIVYLMINKRDNNIENDKPTSNLEGEDKENEKLTVLIDLFGQETPVEITLSQVEKA